ncbi:hypothetical protein OYC64_004825 [Pagothenia borchgrevinki]|uniref:Uncharacterized protein n=1 Tax=Pagothenia borchgrevinki TaxID=8213 RepID=A0ABD2GDI4_PAGBO
MPGKNFYVQAGGIKSAHQDVVEQLEGDGHIQVFSPEESDFILVFCPTASRLNRDISATLDNLPDGKPTIMVVMHHTHDPDYDVNESKRSVDNPKVFLTVDFLYQESNLLRCNHNKTSLLDVQRAARGPQVEVTQKRVVRAGLRCKARCSGFTDNWKYIWIAGFIVVLAFLIFKR